MENEKKKFTKDSTPVDAPKDETRNLANQSTEKKKGGNIGVIAIIVIAVIIILGLLFFSDLWV